MNKNPQLLAVISARGSLNGLPLSVHSVRLADSRPEIDRSVISTDAREFTFRVVTFGSVPTQLREENSI